MPSQDRTIYSAYIRENQYYSADELRKMLSFNAESFSSEEADHAFADFVKELKTRDVLKIKKKGCNEEEENGLVFENFNDNKLIAEKDIFSFRFVGIIVYQNRVLYCYPKYLVETDNNKAELQRKLRQVIRVIEKYSREIEKQNIRDISLFTDLSENGEVNLLAVMLFLLEDYAQHGIYEREEEIIETCGNGEILWQKTVDETQPIIVENRPYYVEYFTQSKQDDENDYIRRLHAWVVTRCSNEVEKTGLSSFFGLPVADISGEKASAFGDVDYISDRLEERISVSFDDRRIALLKALLAYFKSNKVLLGSQELQLIGTRSFHLVWENVVAKVYGSQRDLPVSDIDPIRFTEVDKKPTLVQLIKKPVWRSLNNKEIEADKTLTPDYLRFQEDKNKEEYVFVIIDAKYYCPRMDLSKNKIVDQPGVEDIAKQYLYHLAYAKKLNEHNIDTVKNYFVMPMTECAENDGYNHISSAKLEIFDAIEALKEGTIAVRFLTPSRLYDEYLSNRTLVLSNGILPAEELEQQNESL